jgi:hypothetical protein
LLRCPPLLGWAAEMFLESLLPPIGRTEDVLLASLPPIGRAAEVLLAPRPPPPRW